MSIYGDAQSATELSEHAEARAQRGVSELFGPRSASTCEEGFNVKILIGKDV